MVNILMDSQPASISEELAKQFKTHWTSTRINTFMTFMSNQKTNENFKVFPIKLLVKSIGTKENYFYFLGGTHTNSIRFKRKILTWQ